MKYLLLIPGVLLLLTALAALPGETGDWDEK